jgi:hypothetical protein
MNEPTTYEVAEMIKKIAKQMGDDYSKDPLISYAYQTGFLKAKIEEILSFVPQEKLKRISNEISHLVKNK